MGTPGEPIETDALVIGAGPVGLFQVFQLGLLEMRAHVVDSLPAPGGQCVELYADKPIYDIPGLPVCTGRELTERLLRQIEPFRAAFHLEQVVTALQPQSDGRFLAETSCGTRWLARTVFIAGGVGAFQPRTLKVDGLERFDGTQLFHRVREAAAFAGQRLLIIGGDEDAVTHAIAFAQAGPHRAASITLMHRRDAFNAPQPALDELRALRDAGRVRVIAGQAVGFEEHEGRLMHLRIATPDGAQRSEPVDALLVLLGLSPRLGPIADWGLAMERKQIVVDTAGFQTSVPGLFGVGDIVTYPGKKKLILCGFHEATLAAYAAVEHAFPDRRVMLQYTTTSPRLHQLLGVASPPGG